MAARSGWLLALRGALASVIMTLLAVAAAAPAHATDKLQIVVRGVTRSYALHVPESAGGRRLVPVVFVLHGAGGRGEQALTSYRWIEKSDAEGFIVVAPDAIRVRPDAPASLIFNPSVWNDGSDRGGDAITQSDDVGLMDALVETLARKYPIDRRRIYVTGFSSGAGMTQRLGTERSNVFAAIAPVSGQLWENDARLARAIPVFFLVGTRDPLNPYDGGQVRTPWGNVENKPPIRDVPKLWAALDGCRSGPRPLESRPNVTAQIWVGCRDGAEVVFYAIDGMGHHWPGGRRGILPSAWVGAYSNAVDATDLIWSFFRRHSL